MKNEGMPKTSTIVAITRHTKEIHTFYLRGKLAISPGQFLMLWIPGIDEKPYTVSFKDKNTFGITVQIKGNFGKELFKKKKGDLLGYRGPFGKGYAIKNPGCIVGGGVGMAELTLLYQTLNSPTVLYGAQSKEKLVFKEWFKSVKCSTDDGSFGHRGTVADLLKEELKKKKIKVVYTCGPEIMMQKIFNLCETYKVNCQVSVERYMKCGIGICDSCSFDDKLLCVDGPVIHSKDLRSSIDFGKFARLKSGRRVSLDIFGKWRG